MKKFNILAGLTTLSSLFMAKLAGATSFFTVPTSTVPDLTANVSDTIADPGVLLLLVFAIGVPLVFYLFHRIKRVAPGGGR